jgi:UDP-N-acetylmuramoylalanine--D-glutamate ligase
MIYMINFKGKKVTVMGLGLHGGGLSVTKFLCKSGAKVTVTDLKSKKELETSIRQLKNLPVKYVLGRHELADFTNADLIIQNPGVPRTSEYLTVARKNKIPIETDLSLFFKLCPSKKIIGITGTKGKSTTTFLVYQIFKKYRVDSVLGGNIRISPLEFLPKIKNDTPVILELSSWQLEGLALHKLSPQYAIITNVLRDHLNRYNGLSDYAQAKELIFKFQQRDNLLVLNFDNALTKSMAARVRSKLLWFALNKLPADKNGCYLEGNKIIFRQQGKKEEILKIEEIKIPGQHNLANILAAVAIAKAYGISTRIIRQVVMNFKGIESRLELIREVRGVKYYNDTTATTPDATIAALNSFKQKVVLLAGGTDKGLVFQQLAKALKEKTKALILFEGTATVKLAKELKNNHYQAPIFYVKSMPEAFKRAKSILEKGDIFLLSPAAASFGLFVNEFDRGDKFNKQIKLLK